MTHPAITRRALRAAAPLAVLLAVLRLAQVSAQTAPPAAVEAPEVLWYDNIEAAQAAARESGKPIYAFLYEPDLKSCLDMRYNTFADPQVATLLQQFVCCGLDADDPANRALTEKYVNRAQSADDVTVVYSSLPANLFTDATGKEHYLCWAYMPPEAFAWVLQNVLAMVQAREVLAQTPDDARANADLGQAMLELDLIQAAPEPLQRAVAADPENRVGALEDASLNLLIIAIPDGPAASAAALTRYLTDYPNGRNLLKARYYLAAALAGQDDRARWTQAREVLAPFYTYREGQPEYTSRWTIEALHLDALIEQALRAPQPR